MMKQAMLEWTETMSLGIPAMDEEHRRFFPGHRAGGEGAFRP